MHNPFSAAFGQPIDAATLDDVLAPVRARAQAMRRHSAGGAITLARALELHLSRGRAARTEQDYRAKVRLYLSDWADRPLISLSRAEVHTRHREITKKAGPYSANSSMRILAAVWNRARRQHPEMPETPTHNVDWNREQRRKAAIPVAELPAWWQLLAAQPNPVLRDFYRLALFTGLRRRNLEQIRVEHVDLQARTLYVPKPKSGRPFSLPLSDYLLSLLAARLRTVRGPWLFPSARGGHVAEPRLPALGTSVNAMRHTYISAATAAGVHQFQLKLLVNRAVPVSDITAGYLRADVDSLREPQQKVTNWLLAHLEPGGATVLPLRARHA